MIFIFHHICLDDIKLDEIWLDEVRLDEIRAFYVIVVIVVFFVLYYFVVLLLWLLLLTMLVFLYYFRIFMIAALFSSVLSAFRWVSGQAGGFVRREEMPLHQGVQIFVLVLVFHKSQLKRDQAIAQNQSAQLSPFWTRKE